MSLSQVGFLPIYDSRDMSLQRKRLLFWFLNQKKILPFFKSVEMGRVTQRNMKCFQGIEEDYQSGIYGLLDNTGHETSSLGFSTELLSVYERLHFFERSSFLLNNLVLLQCLSMLM